MMISNSFPFIVMNIERSRWEIMNFIYRITVMDHNPQSHDHQGISPCDHAIMMMIIIITTIIVMVFAARESGATIATNIVSEASRLSPLSIVPLTEIRGS